VKYIDGLLTPGLGDTQSEESFLNYEKYINEMENIRERCLKASQHFANCSAMDVPEKTRANQNSSPDFIAATAKAGMQALYENMGCLEQYRHVDNFLEHGPLKKTAFFLDCSHDKKKSV